LLLALWTVSKAEERHNPFEDQNQVISIAHLELRQPFIDEGFHPLYWEVAGDTVIDTQHAVELTMDLPGKRGALWSKFKLPEKAWQVEFGFDVNKPDNDMVGDGFAMWAIQETYEPGPVFGSRNEFTGLGVFFDTFENARHRYSFPYIMGMLGDGKTTYNHNSDGDDTKIGGCEASFVSNTPSEISKARVTYIQNQLLQVDVQYGGDDTWKQCFVVSELSLPVPVHLGFSAATGDLSAYHGITYVKAATLNPAAIPSGSKQAYVPAKPMAARTASALGFYLKLVVLGTVCAVGLFAYRAYIAQANKRF